MKKDDMLEITIEDISSDGSGVGKADGFALFVKDTIPGDQVKVKIMKMKKRYGYARLMEILVPSPDRIQAPCPVARQCGGCQIQQMSYERQLTFKENKVCNNLRRLGGLDLSAMEVEPICGMEEPFHYRNKAQFPIGRDKNGKIIAGFYAGRTHSIIANTDCLLGAEENEAILNEVISWMEVCKVEPYDEKTGKGLVRHVLIRKGFTTKELMVCLVINGRKIPQVEKLVDRLQKIEGMTAIMANVNTEQTNVILGKEIQPIWGQDYIEDYIGNVKYRISPLSFYQVNPVQTEKLYGKALEYAGLTGKETVWDLYCGIGTISLFLAQKAKQVYGVEIVPPAIADAKDNARRNGIQNAEFYFGKAEEILPHKYETENVKADVIVVDPPRKGCDEALLETIVKMQPERVVYVSCDSATLARDLKYLTANGYKAERLATVDMFPMTVHVESAVKLVRENQRIETRVK